MSALFSMTFEHWVCVETAVTLHPDVMRTSLTSTAAYLSSGRGHPHILFGTLTKMSTMRILDFQALHHLCCKSVMFDRIQAAAKILEVTDGKTGRQIWKTLVLLGTVEIISTGYNPVLPQGKYVSLIASVNACSIELDLHS